MEVVEVSGGREARKVQQQQRTNLPLSAHQKKRAALALPCLVFSGVSVVVVAVAVVVVVVFLERMRTQNKI